MDNGGVLVHFVIIIFIHASEISKLSMIIGIEGNKIGYFSKNLRISEQLLIYFVIYLKIQKK